MTRSRRRGRGIIARGSRGRALRGRVWLDNRVQEKRVVERWRVTLGGLEVTPRCIEVIYPHCLAIWTTVVRDGIRDEVGVVLCLEVVDRPRIREFDNRLDGQKERLV